MKNINKKITLAILLSATLLQGCATAIVTGIVSSVTADAIKTSFSKDDFGLIDDGLKNKTAIYVGFDTFLGEVNAKGTCDYFKKSYSGNNYDCRLVALTKEAHLATKLTYSKPDVDGVYLKITKLDFATFTGTTYQVAYKDMLTGKINKFKTPGFFKRSQIIKYITEYLVRLAEKADDKNK